MQGYGQVNLTVYRILVRTGFWPIFQDRRNSPEARDCATLSPKGGPISTHRLDPYRPSD